MNKLQQLVENCGGVENTLFLVPMSPLNTALFGMFAFKSSSDKMVLVPAYIDQKRYTLKDGYKVQLRSIYPEFGKDTFYQRDLFLLIESGQVHVFSKEVI